MSAGAGVGHFVPRLQLSRRSDVSAAILGPVRVGSTQRMPLSELAKSMYM